jgi:peptidoglycan/LPS O-acetylase OafA/YrhL
VTPAKSSPIFSRTAIEVRFHYDARVTAPSESARRIPELDGIRGLAILMVLVWHYLVCLFGAPPPLFRVLNLTWTGVALFFVLSGFLIGGILLDHRDAPNYFGVFYRRRVCRIFPLYYCWFLLYLVLRPWIGSVSDWLFAHPMPFWSYVTYTQNFFQAKSVTFGANWLGVTWSLAVEEQFYLLLPLVIWLVPSRWLPVFLAPLILLAPLARAVLYDPSKLLVSYVLLVSQTDALLLGVFCAWLIRRRDGVERIANAAPVLRILLFSFGGFACLAAYVPETRISRVTADSLLAVAYAALILLVRTTPQSALGRISRWTWLRRLGTIAYGVYIIHMGVFGLVFAVLRGHWPYYLQAGDLLPIPISLLLTLLIASASWRWFEKPFVAVGQRYRYREDRNEHDDRIAPS